MTERERVKNVKMRDKNKRYIECFFQLRDRLIIKIIVWIKIVQKGIVDTVTVAGNYKSMIWIWMRYSVCLKDFKIVTVEDSWIGR